MAALHARVFLVRDVLFHDGLQLLGAAAQALQLALDQPGVLVRDALNLLRDSLRRALREAQQLDEVARRAERAAARLTVHGGSLAAGG